MGRALQISWTNDYNFVAAAHEIPRTRSFFGLVFGSCVIGKASMDIPFAESEALVFILDSNLRRAADIPPAFSGSGGLWVLSQQRQH
jgi:hypothetical protein